MNCPVCDRSLAPTLSICPSCGAMMFDSVREELQSKITSGRLVKKAPAAVPATPAVQARVAEPAALPLKIRMPEPPAIAVKETPAERVVAERPAAPAPVLNRTEPELAAKPRRPVETTDLSSPKTSPTLVGFQSRNPTVPDWRLQLQNAVQQRKGGQPAAAAATAAVSRIRVAEVKDMSLSAEGPATPSAVSLPDSVDPRVARAMQRIAQSRDTFLERENKPAVAPAKPAAPKVHRFDLNAPAAAVARPAAVPQIKPRLVPSAPAPVPVTVKRDTNKLPPIVLDRGLVAKEEPASVDEISKPLPAEFGDIKRIRIAAEHNELDEIDVFETDTEEIEDLAHVSMRFGAGLFDFIITSFIGLALLSPVLFTRDGWFSPAGLVTFAGVTAVVMFVYMTVCLGFYGKTIGMRLFSLELVDATENEYPTLHQAAVNSSVFILSLVFGGLGFITMLFNEEKRAAHDLLSGTILVREF